MSNESNLPEHLRQAFARGGTVTHGGQQFETAEALLSAYPNIATAHEETNAFSESANQTGTQVINFNDFLKTVQEKMDEKDSQIEELENGLRNAQVNRDASDKEVSDLKKEVESLKEQLATANELLKGDDASAKSGTEKPKTGK